jgi:hypothetical protein
VVVSISLGARRLDAAALLDDRHRAGHGQELGNRSEDLIPFRTWRLCAFARRKSESEIFEKATTGGCPYIG